MRTLSSLSDAIHEVAKLSAIILFDKAVDIGLEAGELLVELPRELQELHDCPVEPLAGNEERDAGRIGREQHARHAALDLVDLDAVDVAVSDVRKGIRWLHRRLH